MQHDKDVIQLKKGNIMYDWRTDWQANGRKSDHVMSEIGCFKS